MATSQAVHEQQCPECNGTVSTTDTEDVCQSCGLVLDDAPIDPGPEWRAFGDGGESEDRAKYGKDPGRPDKGLGSEIDHLGKVPADDTDAARRERIHRHTKNGSHKDHNRGYATGEIHRMASALDLPDSITTQAKHLFRQVHDDGFAKGYDLDIVSATALYTVCRVNQRGLTPSDVANVARTDAESLARGHRRVCDAFGVQAPPPKPDQRLRVVATELGACQGVIDDALGMLADVDGCEKFRGSPSTLVAALLYRAAEDYTQKEVADAAGCTAVSIRNRADALEGDR